MSRNNNNVSSVQDVASALLDEKKFRFNGKLTRHDWVRWMPLARSYIRKGGKGLLLDLIDVTHHRMICTLLRKSAVELENMSNDEFIRGMDIALLPASAHEVLLELAAVKLGQGDLRACVGEYIGEYDVILKDLPDQIKPPAKGIVRLFLKGLVVDEPLRRLVAEGEPETFAAVAEASLKAVDVLRQARMLVGSKGGVQDASLPVNQARHRPSTQPAQSGKGSSSSSSSGMTTTASGGTTNSVGAVVVATTAPKSNLNKRQGEHKQVVCFNCGKEGHVRRQCTEHQKAYMMTESGATGAANIDDVFIVDAELNGKKTRVLLDTGATRSVVSTKLSKIIGGANCSDDMKDILLLGGQKCTPTSKIQVDILEIKALGLTSERRGEEFLVLKQMPSNLDAIFSATLAVSSGLLQLVMNARVHHQLQSNEIASEDQDWEEVSDNGSKPDINKGESKWCDGIVDEFKDVFDESLPVGGAKVSPMPIVLKDGFIPPKEPLRVYSKDRADALDALVDKGLKEGVFVRAPSSVSSPPYVFPKPNDPTKYRMTIDFRRLNEGVVPLNYPMPNLEKSIEALAGYKFFSKLDLRDGYHQVPIRVGDRWKTGFVTRRGAFQYTRVPMGLTTAPHYFQGVMMEVMKDIPGVVVFVDDIVVAANTKEEMLQHLRTVFQRCRMHDFRLKKEKCVFGATSIKYLGFELSQTGIQLDVDRRVALQNIQPPKSAKQLRSFLGLANFFRRLVENYAMLADPLYKLLKKRDGPSERSFPLTDEMLNKFNMLKKAIAESPVCHHLNYEKPIYVRTDASDDGLGAMLYQMVDGVATPIAYMSRTFKEAERHWTTAEKEAYAVFYSVTKWESLLLGHPFVVETDNRAVAYMQNSRTPKILRWRLKLNEFTFTTQHISGANNVVADGLSRCLAVTDQHEVDSVDQPEQVADTGKDTDKIAVQDTVKLKHRLLQGEHNAVTGHQSATDIVRVLNQRGFSWANMENEAKQLVAQCGVCQKLAEQSEGKRLHGTTFSNPGRGVFVDIQMDHIGPFPADANGNKYVLVIICLFSRYVVLYPTRTKDAEESAAALLSFVCTHRVPKRVDSDKGGAFVSEVMQGYVRMMGISHTLHTPYFHEESGTVERANRSLLKHLRALVMEARVGDRWSLFLPLVQRVMNRHRHTVTGVAPNQLVFTSAIVEEQYESIVVDNNMQGSNNPINELKAVEVALLKLAHANQKESIGKKHVAATHDSVVVLPPWVLVRREIGDKLSPLWTGPHKTIKQPDEHGVVTLQPVTTTQPIHVHVSKCKPFTAANMTEGIARKLSELDNDEYELETILDHRPISLSGPKKQWMFWVKWANYPEEYNEWLPYMEVRDTKQFQAYMETIGKK
jgi:hypothetical protein